MLDAIKARLPKRRDVIFGVGVAAGVGLTLFVFKDRMVLRPNLVNLIADTGVLAYLQETGSVVDFDSEWGTFVLSPLKK